MSARTAYRALVVLGCALLFLMRVDHARDISPEVHNRINSDLSALKEWDARLDQHLLLARFGQLLDYDPIVQDQAEIAEISRRNREAPAYLFGSVHLDFEHQISRYAVAVAKKTDLIESFKSSNAVLKNSLRFVPEIFREIRTGGRVELPPRISQSQLDGIERDVLIFSQTPDSLLGTSILARCGALHALVSPREARAYPDVMAALAHVESIVNYLRRADGSLDAALEVPTARLSVGLVQSYTRAYVVAHRLAARTRTLLNLVALLLLLVAVYVMIELQNATRRLAQANATLEERVAMRTVELEGANQQLVREIDERSRISEELRRTQKLEAVGRLAAGVAHEINTPVQFVSDSLQFLKESMEQITVLIAKYRAVVELSLEGAPAQDAARAALKAEEDADISYVLEHAPGAFERSQGGLSRVAKIVRSLRVFAHPDQNEMAPVDLNTALESTLTIASSEYKYVAETVLELGELPQVTCMAGEINQVFLNLIVNAAQAIGQVVAGTDRRGLITVRTRAEGEWAVIEIQDTGGGIPESAREKIFDPFFTTKEVGKGTGQGLSIARGVIVESHGGEIDFTTETGVGTTFTIRLPLQQADRVEQQAA